MASDSRLSTFPHKIYSPPFSCSRINSEFLIRKASSESYCSPSPVEELTQNWIRMWSYFSSSSLFKAFAARDTSWKLSGERSNSKLSRKCVVSPVCVAKNVADTSKYYQKSQQSMQRRDDKFKLSSNLDRSNLEENRLVTFLVFVFIYLKIAAQVIIRGVLKLFMSLTILSCLSDAFSAIWIGLHKTLLHSSVFGSPCLETSEGSSDRKLSFDTLNAKKFSIVAAIRVFTNYLRDISSWVITKLMIRIDRSNNVTSTRSFTSTPSSPSTHIVDVLSLPSLYSSVACSYLSLLHHLRVVVAALRRGASWRGNIRDSLSTRNSSNSSDHKAVSTRFSLRHAIILFLAGLPTGEFLLTIDALNSCLASYILVYLVLKLLYFQKKMHSS